MSIPVTSLPPLASPEIRMPALAGEKAAGESFNSLLGEAIRTVEDARRGAGAQVEKLLSGESGDLHTAVLATERAELAFELFLQVRNKVVQAYQEIMRMPL